MDRRYSERIALIESCLQKALPKEPSAAWMEAAFAPPASQARPPLAESLTVPCADMLSRGGKRWRPLLSLLVCEALGGGGAVIPLLPLVEFPHNASLIHDDIEDSSEERRGKAALHCIYGQDTAINAGAFLYFLPLYRLESWEGPAELKNYLYRLWGEHMRALHLGQAMDIAWHRGDGGIPEIGDYLRMCALKTGCLARFAGVLGVHSARGLGQEAEGLARVLGEAAEKLGVGFQILDDVKNLTTGNPGKKRGDDVVEGKRSLPVLLLLHQLPELQPRVEACFAAARSSGIAAAEVEELIALLEGEGCLKEAEQRGRHLIGEARHVLAGEGWEGEDNEGRELLASFTDLLQ